MEGSSTLDVSKTINDTLPSAVFGTVRPIHKKVLLRADEESSSDRLGRGRRLNFMATSECFHRSSPPLVFLLTRRVIELSGSPRTVVRSSQPFRSGCRTQTPQCSIDQRSSFLLNVAGSSQRFSPKTLTRIPAVLSHGSRLLLTLSSESTKPPITWATVI